MNETFTTAADCTTTTPSLDEMIAAAREAMKAARGFTRHIEVSPALFGMLKDYRREEYHPMTLFRPTSGIPIEVNPLLAPHQWFEVKGDGRLIMHDARSQP